MRIRTTAYHPQSNGIIERFHHMLKGNVETIQNTICTESLPVMLQRLRTAIKRDIPASSA